MRYLAYLAAYLVMQVIAYLLTPFLPLFAERRLGPADNANATAIELRLPQWLAWFDTPDNSLWGDYNWRRGRDATRYISMVAWLYRNSLYGFKWTALACQAHPELMTRTGNPHVNRNNGITGLFRASQPGGYWQWKLVKKLVGDWGVMWNFGWQLDTFAALNHPGIALFQFSPRIVRIR